MKIQLNNNLIDVEGVTPTVQALLEQQNIFPSGIAVAVNDRIVRKLHWGTTFLNPDDKVTLIKVAFGG